MDDPFFVIMWRAVEGYCLQALDSTNAASMLVGGQWRVNSLHACNKYLSVQCFARVQQILLAVQINEREDCQQGHHNIRNWHMHVVLGPDADTECKPYSVCY